MGKKILSILLATVIGLALVACDTKSPEKEKADQLFAEGNYSAALDAYTDLADKDSQNKLKQCNYEIAAAHMEKGDFATALPIFVELGEYKDAQDKANACKYGLGIVHLENSDYEAALAVFTELGDYEDAQTKLLVSKYGYAGTLFENGAYQTALELYTELGEYEDAADKASLCEREIGMRENADYAFLADLETSILKRMRNEATKNPDDLVFRELMYMEKYAGKTFYDSKLKAIARKYLDGLHDEEKALQTEPYSAYQIEWQQGLVLRSEALADLYNDYGFLTDNTQLVDTYITPLETNQYILAGYYAIADDLQRQYNTGDFAWQVDKWKHACQATLVNNTKYTFGMYIDLQFLDKEGIAYETTSLYIDNVTPEMTYTLDAFLSDTYRLDTVKWEVRFDYIA